MKSDKIDFHSIEKKWQAKWEKEKAFEANPNKKNKFFINFPYPYINGYLHLGHAFSFFLLDVAARYKRMNGFNVLFPQGWHCTGTPVWAAAQRIKEKEENQVQIMKSMGFSEKEIGKFGDVKHWIDIFVPAAREDLSKFGASVDWRRSFITTDLNPHYDKFIQWQFRKLKDKGYIGKGKRPVVWCTKDEMVVGDHDRIEGEGVTPQEYYLLKFKFGDDYLVAATLRPETVFGQTNFWVNPNVNYVRVKIGEETWIISKECMEKLKEQDREVKMIGSIKGNELIGKYCEAPLIKRKIMILPARFVDPNIGTGLVTSVPSDAPYDYIALKEIQELDARAKKELGFNLKQIEELEDIEIIPIIKTDKYGDKAAVSVVEKAGIIKQDDPRLDNLTQEVYKEGFHSGILLDNCGKYAGMRVREAKDKIKEDMAKRGFLEVFYDLNERVVCRCLTPSVVKIVSDQWFLKYGNAKWKELVRKELEKIELYPELVRAQFRYVIDWLNDWACTHYHGTGTKLPWDEKWVIESLSDSTIYMAYYTIAHLIREYPVEKINDSFFNFIFLGKGKGDKKMQEMKKEFEYWYPFDIRSSGKDLVQNHLSFCLFNHAAIFPEKYWPRGLSVNGWLLVEGDKMSKSKGNFFTIRQMLQKYPADAIRGGLIVGGEGLDDPNFDFNNVEILRQKLIQLYNFIKDNYNKASKKELSWGDRLFISLTQRHLKEGVDAMEKMMFRTAFDRLFFQLQRVSREYINRGEINQQVLNDSISIQIRVTSPFCPHIAEELWELIGGKGLVSLAEWPKYDEKKIDTKIEEEAKQVDKLVDDVKNISTIIKENDGKEVKSVFVYVIPPEKKLYEEARSLIENKVGFIVKVYAVNDKNKYDPTEKSLRAKHGRPSIYLE